MKLVVYNIDNNSAWNHPVLQNTLIVVIQIVIDTQEAVYCFMRLPRENFYKISPKGQRACRQWVF